MDAATLKNIIHTFPRRSLLGNTDTVKGPWLVGPMSIRPPRHSTMGNTVTVWVSAGLVGCVEYGSGTQWHYGCPECGDQVSVFCRSGRGEDAVPATRQWYGFDSLAQWLLFSWISSEKA